MVRLSLQAVARLTVGARKGHSDQVALRMARRNEGDINPGAAPVPVGVAGLGQKCSNNGVRLILAILNEMW